MTGAESETETDQSRTPASRYPLTALAVVVFSILAGFFCGLILLVRRKFRSALSRD